MTLQTTDLKESLIDGFLKMSVSFFMIPVGIQLGKAKKYKYHQVSILYWSFLS